MPAFIADVHKLYSGKETHSTFKPQCIINGSYWTIQGLVRLLINKSGFSGKRTIVYYSITINLLSFDR
jgi:hypothetical protein